MNRTYLRVACVLIFGCAAAMGQDKSQTVTVALSRPGQPVSLKIDIFSARIEVIGEDRQDAVFSIASFSGERKLLTPSGPMPLPGGNYQVDVEERDNSISVDAGERTDRVEVVARIPRHADVELSTRHDGEIRVRDIVGNLQLENGNGPISATNIQGSVIAEGLNEAITVDLAAIDKNGAMALSSLNGVISLSIPADVGVDLLIDTAKGEIRSDFEMTLKPGKPAVRRSERGDRVSVQVEDPVVATVNGGGPLIRIKTLHGDIRIAKSTR
jgi:hypothetical protein